MNKNLPVVYKKRNLFSRIKEASAVGLAGASGLVLASSANAAGQLDFSGATSELDGAKTSIIAVIGALVAVIGIGIAWAYFKRTAH